MNMYLCRDGDGRYWLSNSKPYKRFRGGGYHFYLWDKTNTIFWKRVSEIDSLGGELNYGQVRNLSTLKVINYAYLNAFTRKRYYQL